MKPSERFLSVFCILLSAVSLYSQTPISGPLSGILPVDSYLVTDNISVAVGDSLIIQAGTTILFRHEKYFYIYGYLSAVGTAEDSIYFEAYPGVSHWSGIRFVNSDEDTSRLEYCSAVGRPGYGNVYEEIIGLNHSIVKISNCTVGHNHRLESGCGISAEQSSVLSVSNSHIFDNSNSGVGCADSYLQVVDSFIDHNRDTGIWISILNNDSRLVIQNCTIENNGKGIVNGAYLSLQNSVIRKNGTGIVLSTWSISIIQGCSIYNNKGISGGFGRGIYAYNDASNVDIIDCEIFDNECNTTTPCAHGGGLKIGASSANIIDCRIYDNFAIGQGGGLCMFVWNFYVENTQFNDNSSSLGGGLSIWGYGTINDCIFSGNHADIEGGGVYVDTCWNIQMNNCQITNNTSGEHGGGISINTFTVLQNCLIAGNSALNKGGGVYNLPESSSRIASCTIIQNYAGLFGAGVADLTGTCSLVDNIICSNTGTGAVWANSVFPVFNYNLLFENAPNFAGVHSPRLGIIDRVNANGDSCDLHYNIYYDPLFEDALNKNFRLQANSPCIDAGDPLAPLDPDSTIADMGAYFYDQSGIDAVEPAVFAEPNEFRLYPAYPNPFNNSTTIEFDLAEAGEISLKVYDIGGREVQRLEAGGWKLGKNSVVWDAGGQASGVYFVRLEAGNNVQVQKVALLK